MTRETKVGLGMAGAFLTLVGGVLGYKMWSGSGQPEDGQAAHNPSEERVVAPATKKDPVPATKPDSVDPTKGLAKVDLVPPPPDGPPVDPADKLPKVPVPPSPGPDIDFGPPPPLDKPDKNEKTDKFPKAPPLDPPGFEPMKPIEKEGVKPPPIDVSGPPPLDPPGDKPKESDKPKEKDKTGGPPALDPPGFEPIKPPAIDPKKPPEFEPIKPPIDAGKKDGPRVKIEIPDVPPIDPPNKYDRTYETPKPRDPDKNPGVPIAIKSQPDHVYAPPPPIGSPITTPKDNWTSTKPDGVRPDAIEPVKHSPGKTQVESFDYELYRPKKGDTFASISEAKYGTAKYQHALLAFNQKRDPQLTDPVPGKPLAIPPSEYLEQRFPTMIAGMPAGNGNKEVIAKTPIKENDPPLIKDAGKLAGDKQYKVRNNDTIWIVAKRTLGNGERWPEILRLNKETLKDVNQLQAGMVLKLPSDAKVDGLDAPQ